MSPSPRVIVHPRSERWSIHAAALLTFLFVTPALQSPPLQFTLQAASLLGALLALLGWWGLDAVLTRRTGLLVRVGWSGRGRRLELEVIQGWRRLASIRIAVSDYHGETRWVTTPELKARLSAALSPHAESLSRADPLHIVGLADDDAALLVRLIREAAHTA